MIKPKRNMKRFIFIGLIVVILVVLAFKLTRGFQRCKFCVKVETAKAHLQSLRSATKLCYASNNRNFPAAETVATDLAPDYIKRIPEDPFFNSNTINTTQPLPLSGDPTGGGGWIYDATTGGWAINVKAEDVNRYGVTDEKLYEW